MQLIVSRLTHEHHGLTVLLKDEDKIDTIAVINGNKPDYHGPVILFGLDQDIVYGMSHREVVSRIYGEGPQILLTTKELAHRLYEHGMKAALGKIALGSNTFLTCLDTYYKQTLEYARLRVETNGGKMACRFFIPGYQPILLTTGAYRAKESIEVVPMGTEQRIDIDKIQTEVTKKLVSY